MSTNNQHVDPDDFFSDTRMSFGEHIEDLRTHLIRAIKGFLLAMIVGLVVAKPVLRFIAAPVERQLYAYWDRFYEEKKTELMNSVQTDRGRNASTAGFVLGSPWIFYQIWSFVAAGLYPHEKKYVNMFLPVSIGLFLFGVAVCEFFVMDKTIEALLWFNEFLGMAPDLRLSEWLGFAIFMPLV